MGVSWKPHQKHGELTETSDQPDTVFAFRRERKEPLTDAQHVRDAIARFDQVIDVSNAERAQAFENIRSAAQHYGVEMSESEWEELGRSPTTGRTAADRKSSAWQAAETRKSR